MASVHSVPVEIWATNVRARSACVGVGIFASYNGSGASPDDLACASSLMFHYFQPLDFRVNRAGNVGWLSGAGSESLDATLISRSSSSSLGSPTSWSTNISECCDGISNFLPHVLHVTSS